MCQRTKEQAMQIRSHAQKYFLKVQKSGTSEHLPPPRPKRKAAHPYPQKAPKKGRDNVNICLFVTRCWTLTNCCLHFRVCLQQLCPKLAASNFNLPELCLNQDLVSGLILYQFLGMQLIFLRGLTTMCLLSAQH